MPELNETLYNIALFVGIAVAGAIAYLKKVPSNKQPDPVIASIGLELGNRHQTQELIEAVNRIADVLENKRQQSLEEMIKDIHEDMEREKVKRKTTRVRRI